MNNVTYNIPRLAGHTSKWNVTHLPLLHVILSYVTLKDKNKDSGDNKCTSPRESTGQVRWVQNICDIARQCAIQAVNDQ